MSGNADNHTSVQLNTFFCSLNNFVSNGYGITCFELRKLFTGCKCFFSNFNQIHFCLIFKLFIAPT